MAPAAAPWPEVALTANRGAPIAGKGENAREEIGHRVRHARWSPDASQWHDLRRTHHELGVSPDVPIATAWDRRRHIGPAGPWARCRDAGEIVQFDGQIAVKPGFQDRPGFAGARAVAVDIGQHVVAVEHRDGGAGCGDLVCHRFPCVAPPFGARKDTTRL